MGADENTTPAPGQAGTPQNPPEAASGQQGAAGGQSDAARLAQLEAQLAQLTGQLHQGSQTVVQDRLDAPGATADEVRRQLEERDRQRAAEQDKATLTGQVADLAAKVKEMAEKPPEPPVRRVEKFMGWR